MPPGGRFNAGYFRFHILDPLLANAFLERTKSSALRPSVHLDNGWVHSSNASKQLFDENSLVTVPRPPSSPDLASSDFWLFGHVKTSLAG
jgi:hypothetical protein